MSGLYILTSTFILIILAILLWKTMMLPPKSLGKGTFIAAVVSAGVYVVMDALFVACFLQSVDGIVCFRIVSLFFYIIYDAYGLVSLCSELHAAYSKPLCQRKLICTVCCLDDYDTDQRMDTEALENQRYGDI